MTTAEILETIQEHYPDCLTADGFDDAIIGLIVGACRPEVVCYDYQKCVEILQKTTEMDEEEAQEFLEFNTIGAYVGKTTPLFLHHWRR
jgi:hypothetical protein